MTRYALCLTLALITPSLMAAGEDQSAPTVTNDAFATSTVEDSTVKMKPVATTQRQDTTAVSSDLIHGKTVDCFFAENSNNAACTIE